MSSPRTIGAAGHLSSDGDDKLSRQRCGPGDFHEDDGDDSKENYYNYNRDQERDVQSKSAAPKGQPMQRPASAPTSTSRRDHQSGGPAKRRTQGRTACNRNEPSADTMGQSGSKSAKQPSVKSSSPIGACLGRRQQLATTLTSGTSSMPTTLATAGGLARGDVSGEPNSGLNDGSPFKGLVNDQLASQSSGTSIADAPVPSDAKQQQRNRSQDQPRSQLIERPHEGDSPIRSHSALAGSLVASASNDRRDGARVAKVKTTRVRINSTSEQIEDPNWLIRMSQELEQQGGAKRSHLKALQRKLKSTITGHHHSSSTALEQINLSQPTESLDGSSSSPAPPVISTPVKTPVSILKRAGGSNLTNSSQQVSLTGQRDARSPRKSPAPAVKTMTVQTEAADCKNLQESPTRQPSKPSSRPSSRAGQTRQATCSPDLTGSKGARAISESEKAGSSSPRKLPASPSNRPMPICADGQVKVSGWKRNNLLAKTLSHFDEIRGNQRPLFMPTKIRLPNNESEAGEPSKFADIVRQAIIKKNLLQETDKDPTSLDLQTKSGQPKRSSNGELKNTGQSSPREVVRPLSADGFASQMPKNQMQQKRPSSTVPCVQEPANNQQGSAQSSKQQVIVSLNKKPGSSVLTGCPSPVGHTSALASPSLVSQLLSASESNANSSTPRQFKLQLKNQQVLQNLRRQSNEIQASLQHDNHQSPINSGNQQPTVQSQNTHLKDWKRLTGKLALLTGSRGRISNDYQALRLTVSNEEAQSGRSFDQTRLQSALGAGTLLVPGEPSRKLSSSSMVVQSVSDSRGKSVGCGSRSALGSPLLNVIDQLNQRRSSDSEAQKRAAIPLHAEDGQCAHEYIGSKPIVVNRTDLLHLIQVAGVAGAVSTSKEGQPEGDDKNSDDAAITKQPLDSAKDDTVTDAGLCEAEYDSELHNDDECDELGDGESERGQSSPPSQQASGRTSPGRTDLSWVVRKTSKVAFFQQKLRKMRWHSKQQRGLLKDETLGDCENKLDPDVLSGGDGAQKRQSPSINAANKPTTTGAANGDHHGASPIGSDVFMDPTLIGDAIEIFLRSTMQDGGDGHEATGETSLPPVIDHQSESGRPEADSIKLQ